MRNVKRALSLVLTMAMLLGMFMIPTGAASTFTDADLIENTEAVQITSGIGLFAGTADGKFAPKASVTRAQMATIIVKMLRGSDFNADAFKGVGVNPFPDTASFEGGWAEGYINACVQLGVVAGYGDGTFKPGRELTTAEAMTMIINALGIDPGAGEWPINYMAKAEALKLYGDLEVKPATDAPLSRDQLAVIVWEGLQYSPEGKSGYRIPGSDLVFADIADAILANNNSFEGITEAVGQDSLASKVYEIKVATGWITGNVATGADCTVLTLADGSEEYYDVDTSVDMLGHYVTIYYKEQYENDEKPGQVYTVMDESTVVTVVEDIRTAKQYKEVFGKNADEAKNGLLFSSNYAVTEKLSNNMNVAGYTAGSTAPKGTYIIADGAVVAYIAPVTVYASYIVDISTVEGEESVWVNAANGDAPIPNTEGDDQVVEYAGMRIKDYVTYVMVNDIYVLSPVEKVNGAVTKTASAEINGAIYDTITLDGEEYPAFEPQGTSPSNNNVGSDLEKNLSSIQYGQSYSLYITEDGHYVGFETASGTLDLGSTAFLLGSITSKTKDQYGKIVFTNTARGVDLSGNEVMILIGKANDTNSSGIFDSGDEVLGDMSMVLQGYYNYEDSTDKDEKKEGIQVLTSYPGAYSPEQPTYMVKASTTTGTFSGSGSIATQEGIPAFGKTGMKFLTIDGELNDSVPLTVSTTIPTGFHIDSTQNDYYVLVTRDANGAMTHIEAFVYKSSTVIGKDVYFYATQEQIDKVGYTVDGASYNVYSASGGTETEIILDPDSGVTLNTPGMYRGTEDSDGLIVAINPVSASTNPTFNDNQPQVVDNIGFWGLTSNRLRGERMASANGVKIDMINSWNNNASSAGVIDLRSEEEIKASGVAKITSLTQLTTLRENDPGLIVVYSVYMEDATNQTSGTTKTVFITRAIRRTVGMNSIVYALDDPTSGDTMIAVRSLTAALGEEVKVNYEVCENAGPGFYRFGVNADGKLALLPFDTDVVGYGNYGMVAMHDSVTSCESIDASTVLLTTQNAAHSGCGYKCTDSGVEPLKEFYVSANTIILDTDGTVIPAAQMADLCLNNDLVINYYCDTPVNGSTNLLRDNSAELVVIAEKSTIKTSCDGNHEGWTAVASASDITGAGKYYLTGDVAGVSIASGNVELCLNGHSITGTATTSGGALELKNCEGREGGKVSKLAVNGGKATLNDAVSVSGVTVASGATFNMVGGTVSGATNSGVNNSGTFTMSGGTISGNSAAIGGGVYNKGTFTMTGGSISGNESTGNGGGGLYNEGTATIDNGTISGNKIASGKIGGGIYVNGGTVTMNSGSISGNTAAGGSPKGIGVNIVKGTFTMNGGTISGHTTTSTGAGVQVNGGTFNMAGGSITGNTAATYGGGVCVQSGTFNMTGGTIAGNTATNGVDGAGKDVANGYYGGAGGKITISGGTIGIAGEDDRPLVINANTATIKGSAVINGNVATTGTNAKATLNIEGGTFTGNVINGDKPNSGYLKAVLKTFECELNITGGTFKGNVAKGSGDWQNGITLGNVTTTIAGGTIDGDVSDATIFGICELNGTVNDSAFTGGTISGSWTVGTNVAIASGTFLGKTKADLANATIAPGYDVVEDSTGVSIKYTYVAFDAAAQHGAHGIAVQGGDTIYGGVNYYLDSNLTSGIEVAAGDSNEVTLCLNGHTITTSGTAAITVGSGVTLHLCNCQTAGNVKGGAAGSALTISGGTVNMYDNVHMDGGTYSAQGVVTLSSRATFTMNGGTISNNTVTSPATGANSTYAGGIYLASGTVNLYGGAISGNSASNRTHANATTNTSAFCGGGVAVDNGTLNIAGTAIYGNYAIVEAQIGNNGAAAYNYSYAGGGVCFASGTPTLNMTGGIVAGNWAEVGTAVSKQTYKIAAGGIYIHNNQTANISGGVIGGDTAVAVSGGQPTNLGIGTGNYSPISGGGIAARGTVKLSGNAVVKGNTGYIGGVEIYSAGTRVLNLSGNAAITNNTATYRGGGVYCTGGTVTIADNAAVSNNVSAQDGGGICMNGGTITITGGSITGNEATGAANGGGGVCAIGTSTFNMSGGSITGNTSNKNGGGVHKGASAKVNITGGTISGNMPKDKNF